MKKIVLMEAQYSDESLYDATADVEYALSPGALQYAELPSIDKYPEFKRGTFTITVTWEDDDAADSTWVP